jgi:hypothetical protein
MKNTLEKNGYREKNIKCCGSCEYMGKDYDGETSCNLLDTFNKLTHMYNRVSVSELGICNKYEKA